MLYNGAAGYQSDSATGLQLLGHRYYDTSIGRFLSSDPAQAGTNWYAYCDNNPLEGCDPTGLSVLGIKQDVLDLLKDLGYFPDKSTKHPIYKNKDGDRVRIPNDHGRPNENAWKQKKKELEKMKQKRDHEQKEKEENEKNEGKIQKNIDRSCEIGIGLEAAGTRWEIGKWGLTIIAAHETEGGSLALAGSLP